MIARTRAWALLHIPYTFPAIHALAPIRQLSATRALLERHLAALKVRTVLLGPERDDDEREDEGRWLVGGRRQGHARGALANHGPVS